jgi:hypothetical protein
MWLNSKVYISSWAGVSDHRVKDPSVSNSAGSETSWNKILRGLIPLGI